MNWEEFTLCAIDTLRRPLGRMSIKRLDLLVHPTSELMPFCWHLPLSGPDYRGPMFPAVHRAWDHNKDFPCFDQLEEDGFAHGSEEFYQAFRERLPQVPTIHERIVEVSQKVVERHVAAFEQLNLPMAFQIESVGCGGVAVELTFGDYLSGASFRWWGEGPKE